MTIAGTREEAARREVSVRVLRVRWLVAVVWIVCFRRKRGERREEQVDWKKEAFSTTREKDAREHDVEGERASRRGIFKPRGLNVVTWIT